MAKKDPRVVGGRYYSGYWNTEYTVVGINGSDITVVWKGEKTPVTHSQAWNPEKGDRVVSGPYKR